MVTGDNAAERDAERRIALFVAALRQSGLRLTHQRLEVAREIAWSNTHPEVEAIYHGVRERVPTISLDTVYRTLRALERLGLIRRLDALGGPVRYDAILEPHHHFICTRCGLIRDVDGTSFEGLDAPESAAELGRVESITVQLRGLCKSCQESEEPH
jgi:Fur family peroxide stress response transcriptional regulator